MLYVDHTDRETLIQLRIKLAALDDDAARHVLTSLLADGVVRVYDYDTDGNVVDVMSRYRDYTREALYNIWEKALSVVEGMFDQVWTTTLQQITDGHDQCDFNSAGGYCKNELLKLAAAVSEVGLPVTVIEAPEQPTGVTPATRRLNLVGAFEVVTNDDGTTAAVEKDNPLVGLRM